MDPELVAKRRSTIFQRIQFELTQSSIIEKRLSPGKFPGSLVGIVKLIAIILLLTSFLIVVTYGSCPDDSIWSIWLFISGSGAGTLITIIFYFIFTLGAVLKSSSFWFVVDIIFSVVCAVVIIVTSVINIEGCNQIDVLFKVEAFVGIVGSVFLLIESIGLYIMYRHKEHIVVKEVRSNPLPKRRTDFDHGTNNREVYTDV